MLGRKARKLLATLSDGESVPAGSHVRVADFSGLPSGVDFCRMSPTGESGTAFGKTVRLVLMRYRSARAIDDARNGEGLNEEGPATGNGDRPFTLGGVAVYPAWRARTPRIAESAGSKPS